MLRPFALFGTLTLGLHSVAWACSCLQESVEENIDEAELIVFGTVVEIAAEPARPRLTQVGPGGCGGPTYELHHFASSTDRKLMRVQVHDVYKGDADDEIILETALFGASCGLDALEGEDWVFFSGDGTHAFLCSGSHRVDDAATDPGLAALDGYFAE